MKKGETKNGEDEEIRFDEDLSNDPKLR